MCVYLYVHSDIPVLQQSLSPHQRPVVTTTTEGCIGTIIKMLSNCKHCIILTMLGHQQASMVHCSTSLPQGKCVFSILTHTHTRAHTCTHTRICVCDYVCILTYIHTYVHTHAHLQCIFTFSQHIHLLSLKQLVCFLSCSQLLSLSLHSFY